MRQHLAKLVLLSMPLGGCSLIYSSDRLPAVNDAPPADVEPMKLTLERVSPVVLLEGQGDGGSRPAMLVIYGTNIAAGATVKITAHQGELNNPSLIIDDATAVVDAYGQSIAVPIKLNVDANIGPRAPATSPSIRLDVTVTQPAPFTDIRATLGDDEDPVLTLQGLPELTETPTAMMLDDPLYSKIDATDIPTANRTAPLILRSTSSITIRGTGSLALNASGQNPGPGGARGGNGGQPGLTGSPGAQGDGAGGGRPNGGGAGFAQMGDPGNGAAGPTAGDASLTTLDSPNRGSGGAGGKGQDAVLGGNRGGAGGGGGGTLELTAGGDLTIMAAIEANGGKGGEGNGGGNAGATAGGGGSGGVVLLRAGRTLAVAAPGVTATGGPRGDGNGSAGKGSDGRIRIDAPDPMVTIMSSPRVEYRGPMFDPMTPMVVREEKPRLSLVGQGSALIKYTIESEEGTTLGPIEITLGSNGKTTVPLGMPLFRGLNRLCALVTGVTERRDEAENCITLAYLY